jgi:hypothetical protein
MKQNGAPWIIAVLALLAAVYPTSRASEPPSREPGQIGLGAGGATPLSSNETEEQRNAALAARWKNPLRPFGEFFATMLPEPNRQESLTIVPQSVKKGTDREYKIVQRETAEDQPVTVAGVVAEARSHGYELEFLIALAPDPIDSNLDLSFDQEINAIQNAYAAAGYLPDRFWLPWKGDAAEKQLFRRLPGVLLFRKLESSGEKHLAAVFLVGETPKIGVQKAALRAAIALEGQFMLAIGKPWIVRILGPSFSGSAESLQMVLDSLHLKGAEHAEADPLDPRLRYRMVTGSATAKDLEKFLGKEPAFHRTVVSDEILKQQAFCFLENRLGWNLDKVALLTESDTAYGREGAEKEGSSGTGFTPELLTFPSGLSSIRNEWEKNHIQSTDGGPVAIPKSTLSLDLRGANQPVDLVPEFSPMSLRSKDLAIANLLAAISRSGARYIGILATDTRDKLFLAQRIREFSPDVVLFTFDNNLLYAHPEYASAMDGMLVLTSFPLFTESRRWRSILGGPPSPGKYRRQFVSEFEQGVFQAAQELIASDETSEERKRKHNTLDPRIWISAVGNGSLWPIAALHRTDQPATPCQVDSSLTPFVPEEEEEEKERIGFETLAGRADLQLLFLVLGLGALAWRLWQAGRPLDREIEAPRQHRITLGLLGLGWGALWVAGGALLVLGTLPVTDSPWGFRSQALLLTLLGLLYGLVILLAAKPRGLSVRAALFEPAQPVLFLLVIVVLAVIAAFPWILQQLWMPGGAELFHLRARKLSSGLSPIVSVLLWSAAIYVWAFFEIKRRIVATRQFIGWPPQGSCEPPLVRCGTLARPLRRLLIERLPRRTFWVASGILLGPPALFVLATVQPITETRIYGRVFIFLVVFAFVLCAISFYRFVAVWLALEKILNRINHTHLIQAFQRISPQVNWTPMKSFGWQMPNFNLLVLSAEKSKQFLPPKDASDVDRELERLFEAEREGNLKDELAARRKLNHTFSRICRTLASRRDNPAVEDFLATRVVAYIRHIFSHMRHCLTEALASGMLLMMAVRVYAFEPKQFFSLCLWAVMIPAIVLTLWVFLEMDRNASLSAIGGTTPGRVNFDRNFLTSVLSYGLIPLLGVLASLFPQASRLVLGWINPLLRVVGVG